MPESPGKVGTMTTDALFAVFANFNDQIDEPPAAPVEEAPSAFDETVGKLGPRAIWLGARNRATRPAMEG